ncbi:MAG: carboxypeptidase regulatory-like domain-containing protein [Acidobacteria bacterium]|nr:carboxypeptidase regulatory-like domain-containing protein [Acidobacteriota bacterium]
MKLVLWLFALVGPMVAQTITGSIVGSVVDPSNLPVSGATITLTQAATGAERQGQSDDRGNFVFSGLQPGEYSLSVTMPGFKRLAKRSIMLSAQETFPAGTLALEVGAVAESVTVTAQGATVQTASSERAGTILGTQVESLMIKGRNAMSLLQLLPGVVDLQAREERIDRNFDIFVQGNRRENNSVTVDGLVVNGIGNNFNTIVMLGQDAIAEMRVLLTNYPAEYGRSSGATVNLVSKSGGKQFHGLGSYFKRHEQFNAPNFFNNRLGQPKPRYRYNTWNYNVGGPVFIPDKFNRNRDKLFFFWSQEFWPLQVPTAISQITVPAPLERAGDFSQTLDLNARLIVITDPAARAPFPGNRIPANRLDPSGQSLLKVFPEPNFVDRSISAGRYNYVYQSENRIPNRAENLRLDYNINANNSLSGTIASFVDQQEGAVGILTSGSTNWPQMSKKYRLHGQAYVGRYTRVLSPSLINELSVGFTRRPEGNSAPEEEIRRNQRKTIGYIAGQLNPPANPLDLIPNATFGGVTNPANLFMEGRFPFYQKLFTTSLTNNLTKTWGAHTFKLGIAIERHFQGSLNDGQYTGTISFGRDVNNPLDTNYAYSNAAMGVYSTYTEQSARVYLHFRQASEEWFAQDTWKVNRRLTLDYGVRFHHLEPIYMSDDKLSVFSPGLFDRSRQVRLITPARVGGVRTGVDPVTGQVFLPAQIGALVPGIGDPSNGVSVAAQGGNPRGLINGYGILFGPRFGFAWDVFGSGKTAVRGGIGMFYNRPNMSTNYLRFAGQTPFVSNPILYYGRLAALSSSAGVVFPQNINGLDRDSKVPNTINYSFSIQQNVGFGTVLDVAYVGSLGRNLMWVRNINAIPLEANFNPANADPTNPATPLPGSFLRPAVGYNDINMSEAASSSSYHSMQVTARRRFTGGLQFGLAWTWSKALDYNDFDNNGVSTLVNPRVWNYGLASFDRTHVFKLDWVWNVPQSPWKALPARLLLNDWQLSGITSFVSGQPLGIGYSTTVAVDITGSPSQGARIVVLENPVLPKSDRTFSRNFRTDVFRLPARGTIGNAATTLIRGPGINNWDIAIFKDFPVREAMRFQFRWELYNAFNHTQFSALDTAARFDPQGAQVNARFGEFTAARSPRVMQGALRFYF